MSPSALLYPDNAHMCLFGTWCSNSGLVYLLKVCCVFHIVYSHCTEPRGVGVFVCFWVFQKYSLFLKYFKYMYSILNVLDNMPSLYSNTFFEWTCCFAAFDYHFVILCTTLNKFVWALHTGDWKNGPVCLKLALSYIYHKHNHSLKFHWKLFHLSFTSSILYFFQSPVRDYFQWKFGKNS